MSFSEQARILLQDADTLLMSHQSTTCILMGVHGDVGAANGNSSLHAAWHSVVALAAHQQSQHANASSFADLV